MNIHDGHRQRLRDSFSEHGLESFNDIAALELLLFYAIPRSDTNPVAHRLLEQFGSLNAVFNASMRELTEVDGVGENAAVLLRLIPQIMKKSMVSLTDDIKQINCSSDAGRYLQPRFFNEMDEIVLVIFLDSKRCIISCLEMGRGVVNSVDTSIRKITETALRNKACSVILAHNHPNGVALPSKEDDFMTKRLFTALQTIGIRLEDHLIFAGDEFVSLTDSGFMSLYRY